MVAKSKRKTARKGKPKKQAGKRITVKKRRAVRAPRPKATISPSALEEIEEYSATSDEPLSDETLKEIAIAGAVDPERYLEFHQYLAQKYGGESGPQVLVFTELFESSE